MNITKEELIEKLGTFEKVDNINERPNQFIVSFTKGQILFSYSSIIAIVIHIEDVYYLGNDWDYSTTTGKYRNIFLATDKKEVERDIKKGIAIEVNM